MMASLNIAGGRRLVSMLTAGLLASGSVALSQQWADLGTGSGDPPGRISLSALDPSVSSQGRQDTLPQLALDPDGAPVVLFLSRNVSPVIPVNSIHAARYAGGTWSLMPTTNQGRPMPLVSPLPNRPSAAANTSLLAVNGVGTPSGGFINNAYIGFFDGNVWAGRGSSASGTGASGASAFASNVSMSAVAIDDASNETLLAFSAGSSRQRIYAKRLIGGDWQGLGTSATTPLDGASATNATHPAALYVNGTAVVAWTERRSLDFVCLRRFNETTQQWEELAGSATAGVGQGRHPQLVSMPGRNNFWLVYENAFSGELSVKEWTGASFSDRGNPLQPWSLARLGTFNEVTNSSLPVVPAADIALDAFARPFVVFRAEAPAGSGRFHLFASYRNAQGAWVAIGDTAQPLGISDESYTSSTSLGHWGPTTTIGVDQRPIVAWVFSGDGNAVPRILVRRWGSPLSTGVLTPALAIQQLTAVLLGRIDTNPTLVQQLDANEDGILDAADLERWTSRL